MTLLERFSQVKCFVFDMDGVLTNGQLAINKDGQWIREANIKDGYALQLAVKSGYSVVIISGSHSPEMEQRLAALGIVHIYMKATNKKEILHSFITTKDYHPQKILYMGDDIPDLETMKECGLPCCPSNAAIEIKAVAGYISPFAGGKGCVRDVIEKVLRLNDHWPLLANVGSI